MLILKCESPALSAETEVDALRSRCRELMKLSPQARGFKEGLRRGDALSGLLGIRGASNERPGERI